MLLETYLLIVTHPLTLIFIGLTVVFFGIQALVARRSDGEGKKTPFLDKVENPALRAIAFLAILLAPVWVALLLAVLWSLAGVIVTVPAFEASKDTELRWHVLAMVGLITALGGLIGAPLALIRVFTTERQTKATEEGLITDRINKAVEGLGAEKTIKEVHETPRYQKDDEGNWLRDEDGNPIPAARADGTEIVERDIVERSVPNLEVRIGAIYALERIAKDSDRDHVQIMEILCAYIRQNAPASGAAPWPELEIKREEEDGPLDEDWDERLRTFREAQDAAEQAVAIRVDIQTALTVIGRRSRKQRQLEGQPPAILGDVTLRIPEKILESTGDKRLAVRVELNAFHSGIFDYSGYKLNLREVNLQGADLSNLDFSAANLQRSELQGANFRNASLIGADLWRARLQGSDLFRCSLQGARLSEANIQDCFFGYSNCAVAVFHKATGHHADFRSAFMVGGSFIEAILDKASFEASNIQGSILANSSLRGACFRQSKLALASFNRAKMVAASLSCLSLDGLTDFESTDLRQAALSSTTIGFASKILFFLEDTFGDGSNHLPRVFRLPEHWPQHDLGEKFDDEWLKWRDNPDAYIPPGNPMN